MKTNATYVSVSSGLLVGMGFLCCCPNARALDAQDVLYFKVGPLAIKPQAGLTETYSDNIFYLPNHTVQDFLTTISPGLKLQVGRLDHNYISLGYTYDQLFYADNSSLDTGQHTIDIRDHIQGERLALTGSDRYQMLASPLGGVERILAARNIDRTTLDDNYTLSYDLSEKTQVYGRATHSLLDYQSGITLYDSDTVIGTGGFGYRAFPKTIFFGEVYYGETTTERNSPLLPINPDVSFEGGYIGARGNFTEKLTGTVKVGYETRQFSDPKTTAPSDPVVDLMLTERFTERTALTLSYSRQNSVSSQYTSETFTADIIGLQLQQALGSTGKWSAALGGNYTHYAYDFNGLNVANYDNLRGSFNLAYRVRLWLTANLGYDFEQLTGSANGAVDYTVNRVSLRLAIGY